MYRKSRKGRSDTATKEAKVRPQLVSVQTGSFYTKNYAGFFLVWGTLFMLFALMSLLAFSASSLQGADIFVSMTFALNGLIGAIGLIRESARMGFSCAVVHWLFYLIFFVVAPFSQYINDYFCWDFYLSDEILLQTNAVVLLWGIFFLACYTLGGSGRKVSFMQGRELRISRISRKACFVLFGLSAISTVAMVGMVGLDGLLSRSSFDLGLDQTATLIAGTFFRGIPLFAFVLILVRWRKKKDSFILLAVSFALVLISNFPFSMSRYSMAVAYGGVALLVFPVLGKRKGLFALLFLAAFVVIFPAINAFRNIDVSLPLFIDAIGNSIIRIPRGFLSGDYDAYSMLARTLLYVESNGSTMLYQLCGALAFFIPRSLWPSKPVGSGSMIAAEQGQLFVNLSCPLPAEGVINLGLIGLVAFSVFAALACRIIDKKFQEEALGDLMPLYPFIALFLFFVMRGDLLSSWAYLAGNIVVYLILLFIADSLHDKTQVRDEHGEAGSRTRKLR